jgi:hypothetical protein
MRRIQLRKDLYLLLNIFYFVFRTLKVNDLDSHSLLRSLVIATVVLRDRFSKSSRKGIPFVDLSEGAFT